MWYFSTDNKFDRKIQAWVYSEYFVSYCMAEGKLNLTCQVNSLLCSRRNELALAIVGRILSVFRFNHGALSSGCRAQSLLGNLSCKSVYEGENVKDGAKLLIPVSVLVPSTTKTKG